MSQVIYAIIMSVFALVTPDTPESAKDHCQTMVADIQDKISKAKGCTSDDECTIAGLGCPFGCGTPLNKIFEPQIKEAVREYQGQCQRCAYKCSTRRRTLKCHEGECRLLPENPSFSTPAKPPKDSPKATEL
jgi:hypothetical protein